MRLRCWASARALMGLWRRGEYQLRRELPTAPVRRRLHGRVAAASRRHGARAGVARVGLGAAHGPRGLVGGRPAPARPRSAAAPWRGPSCSGCRWHGSARHVHDRGSCAIDLGDAPARPDVTGLLVVDLSALWAGPLCGGLLAGAGATVVKVESTHRPDGARRGPARVLRPVERAQAIRRARPDQPGRRPHIARAGPTGRRRDRGQPSARSGAAGTGRGCGRAGRRSPGLGLHHRLRTVGRRRQPGRLRGRRRRGGRARRLERRGAAVLCRRRRGPAHRADRRRRLRRSARLGWAVAARRVDGGRECRVRRSDPSGARGSRGATTACPPGRGERPGFGADTARVLAELAIEP